MKATLRTFEEKLAFGREIEKAVADWLMQRGHRILPVYDFSGLAEGKAPKLMAAPASGSLILPDLLATRNGKLIWFEVKYKSGPATYTRITGRNETGIDRVLWEHYCAVERESGCPVWLIFAHKAENEIRGASLEELRGQTPRIYEGRKMGRSGVVFFDYARLRLLAQLSDVAPFAYGATNTPRLPALPSRQ